MDKRSGIGSRIKTARGATHQHVFAQQVGASVRAVQYWESGKVAPRAGQIKAIAAATGRPVEFFLADDDEEDEAELHSVISRIVRRQVARVLASHNVNAPALREQPGAGTTV